MTMSKQGRGDSEATSYRYIKNTTAAPLERSKLLTCDKCRVAFGGCEDAFQCPECGRDCDFWFQSTPNLISRENY